MRRLGVPLVIAGSLAAAVAAAAAVHGGWTASTVHPLTTGPVAGEAYRVVFSVRQHGHRLVRVEGAAVEIAKPGGGSTLVPARPLARVGRYEATLTFPTPGRWRWRVVPHPFPAQAYSEIAVVRPGEPAPAPLQGRGLFIRKGCVSCHVGPDDGTFAGAGPRLDDLRSRRVSLAYVRQSILDPGAVVVPGWGMAGAPPVMPTLEVSRAEADAIGRYLLRR
ncbi:MAG: c-type cytochrome [Gaiellales bacterium]